MRAVLSYNWPLPNCTIATAVYFAVKPMKKLAIGIGYWSVQYIAIKIYVVSEA
jgi:hypothetical protein